MGANNAPVEEKPEVALTLNGYKKLDLYDVKENQSYVYLKIPAIYKDGWNKLPQAVFWSKIMSLPKDSGVLNIAKTRTILNTYNVADWDSLPDSLRMAVRADIKHYYLLDSAAHIYFTTGKNQFYDFSNVLPYISEAIPIFVRNGVDPFYAQTILLIESPEMGRESGAGADGYFQLMPRVAIKMGLEVNRLVDERDNFKKSAEAAAKLIKTICIPHLDSILDKHNIAYQPYSLWYRLLVLHIYNAGASNVACAINKLNPQNGGMGIITGLWHTHTSGFRNSSQNYSQVALAALINFDDFMNKKDGIVYPCNQRNL